MAFNPDPRKKNDDFYSMDFGGNDFFEGSTDFQANNYGQPSGQQGFSSPFGQQQSASFSGPPPQQQQHQQQQGFSSMGSMGPTPQPFGMPQQQQQPQPNSQPFPLSDNSQFLFAAGQQLLSNPLAAAAIDAYTQSLQDKTQTYMGRVKSFFAVDTTYVMKKIMIIFLPFLHKEWCIRYSSENVLPKDEPNLPDLYIPSMAFITYCLLSGYILGLQNKFAPEMIGIYASAALAWLFLEVIIVYAAKYFCNTTSSLLGFFQVIAFGGYKFVCTVTILLAAVTFGRTGFLGMFGYCTFSLMFFLAKSLNTNLQTSQESSYSGYESTKKGHTLVGIVCLIQPVIMYALTYSLV